MEKSRKIRGWQIHHLEQLQYRTKSGSPIIQLKFYHYPNYRQKVEINNFPDHCKVKKKGDNSFFLFNRKVHVKGTIFLKRTITVIPVSNVIESGSWGKISSIPSLLKEKYEESSHIWPLKLPKIETILKQEWFESDSLSDWVIESSRFINSIILFRENQNERLGAYKALLSGIGDCDEFTDLFITLARRRGIPCRRITGLYIAEEGRFVEPHAWAEVMSPKLGWLTIDIALNNIGNHTINYVIKKIEEFNPELPDYQVLTKHTSKVLYHWEKPTPIAIPVY